MRGVSGEAALFLGVAAVNFIVSLSVYQSALFFVSGPVSYAIAYPVSIALACGLNARFAFREPLRFAAGVWLVAWQLLALVIGAVVLAALEKLGANPRWAVFIVVAAMTPVNFMVSRLLIRKA